jgi:hypothetical protein
MKGLFWNIRGFNKKGLGPYVRDMMKANKFDCVFSRDYFERIL